MSTARATPKRRRTDATAALLSVRHILAVERIARELADLAGTAPGVPELAECSEQLAAMLDKQLRYKQQQQELKGGTSAPCLSTEAWYNRPALCPHCSVWLSNNAGLKRHTKNDSCHSVNAYFGPLLAKGDEEKEKKEKKDKGKDKKKKLYKLDRMELRSPDSKFLVLGAKKMSGAGLAFRVKGEILVDVASCLKRFHLEPGLEAMVLKWDDHVCLYTPSVGFIIIRLIASPVEVKNSLDAIDKVWASCGGSLEQMNTLDLKGQPIANDKDSMQAFYRSVVGARCAKPATLLNFVVVFSYLKPTY